MWYKRGMWHNFIRENVVAHYRIVAQKCSTNIKRATNFLWKLLWHIMKL